MQHEPTSSLKDSADAARRVRDVVALTALASGIFAILALSSAIGWVEAVTASLVMSASAAAYFVGTSQSAQDQPIGDNAVTELATQTHVQSLPIVLEALPLPALHVDRDKRITAANAHARELFKADPERRALAASVIRHPELLSRLEQALERNAAAMRVEVQLGSGAEQLWLAHIAPFADGQGGALILMEDHTALRRAEQARADFLANASHELRTPLTSLAGFIETMRGPARNDHASWSRYLDIMFSQTERMKRLIADLLSLSRIEFSEHQAPDSVEDIADIVAMVVASMRPLAQARSVELTVEGPPKGLMAVADSDEVAQVAQNLIANAVKYSRENDRVTVTIGLAANMDAAQAQAGRRWDEVGRMTILPATHRVSTPAIWLRVSDTGPGIDRQHLPRLGQRFYRVDESRGGEVTGTGLGLAIVKHIMARHRGGFVVESKPDHGTAFGVWFPAQSRELGTPEPERGQSMLSD